MDINTLGYGSGTDKLWCTISGNQWDKYIGAYFRTSVYLQVEIFH